MADPAPYSLLVYVYYISVYCLVQNFYGGILTDTDFKYLMENILMDGHYVSPCTYNIWWVELIILQHCTSKPI